MSVDHVFIFADIGNKVIIGADFMIAEGLKLDMGQQVMTITDVYIPLTVGYGKQKKAFHTVGECLCTTPLIEYPVAGEKFVLDTDASGYTEGGKDGNAGAVLRRPFKIESNRYRKLR